MPRGKKTCPKCEALTGPRTAVCPCGHEFLFKPGKVPATRKAKAPRPVRTDGLSQGVTAEDIPEIIQMADREAVDSLIEQLKMCRTDADRNGGCFSTFLHHEHGTLQIEVWFPMRLK